MWRIQLLSVCDEILVLWTWMVLELKNKQILRNNSTTSNKFFMGIHKSYTWYIISIRFRFLLKVRCVCWFSYLKTRRLVLHHHHNLVLCSVSEYNNFRWYFLHYPQSFQRKPEPYRKIYYNFFRTCSVFLSNNILVYCKTFSR